MHTYGLSHKPFVASYCEFTLWTARDNRQSPSSISSSVAAPVIGCVLPCCHTAVQMKIEISFKLQNTAAETYICLMVLMEMKFCLICLS